MKAAELQAVDLNQLMACSHDEYRHVLIAELERLRSALIALPEDSSEAEILSCFERCVCALNDVDGDEELDICIDTVDREQLCEALYTMGDVVGLDADTEYVDEWRDW